MNLKYMLDTNTVSYIIRGKSPASRVRLANLGRGAIACISAITQGELQYGLAKRPASTALRTAVEDFVSRIQVLPWTSEEAVTYGALRAKQESTGRPIGNLDILIAAHAISVGATLVTSDHGFSQVSGLSAIENWATDL